MGRTERRGMTPFRVATPASLCHSCGASDLETAPAYARFRRVTSDCKPWPAGGSLARCRVCGLVQTLVGSGWRAEAEEIYRRYTIYHQSGGSEQSVFDGCTGAGSPRSERIIHALRQSVSVSLPGQGRLLDVGCGNGAFLAAWSRLSPGWSLCGSEVDDKHRRRIEAIPGVERLYTCPLEEVPGEFDLISMVHVLEHIPAPARFLERVGGKLRPGGLLLVEVPDCEQNAFMLLVADHCSHFSPPSLAGVVEAAGFAVLDAGAGWVAKEVSLVARKPPSVLLEGSGFPADLLAAREPLRSTSGSRSPRAPTSGLLPAVTARAAGRFRDRKRPGVLEASQRVFANCQQLESILAKVEPLTTRPGFGLFGTAIAATWLDAQTGQSARFFVDEDTNRIGKTHLGRPILAPSALPPRATVFVALPQPLADAVAARLHRGDPTIEVVLP